MAILRIESVKGEFGDRSNSGIYQKVRAGLLTAPVQIGQRAVGWPDFEVAAIGAARIAGQTPDQIRELVKRLHAKRNEQFAALMAMDGAQHEPVHGRHVAVAAGGLKR